MGNFTSIEQEFDSRISPIISQLINSQQNTSNSQGLQNRINSEIKKVLLEMRKEKMQAL